MGDPTPPPKRQRSALDAATDATTATDASKRPRKGWFEPFLYHPLNDLESLWWVGAYFLMSRTLITEDESEVPDAEDLDEDEDEQEDMQLDSLRALFGNCARRSWAFRGENDFREELDSLHPFMREMGLALESVRDTLVRAYHFMEKDIDNRRFVVRPEIYEEMGKMYAFVADAMKTATIRTGRVEGW